MIDHDSLVRSYEAHLGQVADGYARALEACDLDAVVIHSGSPSRRTSFDDQDWPLRPTPHFMHWLPLPEPEALLVIVPGAKPKLLRLEQSNFWEAPVRPESDHFWPFFEVVTVQSHEGMRSLLPVGRVEFVGENIALATRLGLSQNVCNSDLFMRRLDALRTRKSDYEIACLAEANRVAAQGHEVVRGAFEIGDASELDLHLLYLRATRQDDPETPYKNIVAMGAHAATLHHVGYQKTPSGASSLLLDAGATCMGYASDITRTWVRPAGEAARVFAGLLARMEAMQIGLVSSVRTGQSYEALHDRSHRELASILRDCGLVRLSVDAIDGQGITRAFYPHGLGHSLGLQCHDVGCAVIEPAARNPFLRNTSVIAAGQVFTVEPGLYFIDRLLAPLRAGPNAADFDWTLIDALSALGGIRIEDDLVVHSLGVRNLTREHLPVGGGVAGSS